jgi:hypothetical protein
MIADARERARPGPFALLRLLPWFLPAAVAVAAIALPGWCEAHGVEGKDSRFLAENTGPAIAAFLYLGAKHMVTGMDHLLYLAGVIFFLYRARDVALYVTLFALGHSTTLLAGVLGGIHADADLVDAVIGLSVAYKAFENIGGFRAVGLQPNPKAAVAVFGLFHGFGLATKLQAVNLSPDGLVVNMVSFNVGVELGQLVALAVMLAVFTPWRRSGRFEAQALSANWLLMTAGFVLMGFHLTGYLRG